jgi:hypothetical protein
MKVEDSRRRTFVPHDARAADFLLDASNHGLLEQFWGRENTVAQAALSANMKSNSALYRVQRMLKMGLLEVVRIEARRGRAVAHYRVSADEFYIPFEITRFENRAAFARAQLEPLFNRLIETEGQRDQSDGVNNGSGLLVQLNAQRNIVAEPRTRSQLEQGASTPSAEMITSIRSWGTAQISHERARSILERFHAIMTELTLVGDDGPECKTYLFQMTLMKTSDGS